MTAADPALPPSPAPVRPAARAPAPPVVAGTSALRAAGSIAAFVAAVAVGMALAFATAAPAAPLPTNPFASLPGLAAEPEAAAKLVAAVAANDVKTVAETLTPDMLEQLASFLEPVVTVESTRYIGGVDSGGEQIAAYVITGTTELGEEAVVALTVRVRDGKVVNIR